MPETSRQVVRCDSAKSLFDYKCGVTIATLKHNKTWAHFSKFNRVYFQQYFSQTSSFAGLVHAASLSFESVYNLVFVGLT